MSDAPNRTGLPPRYWETTPLDRMTRQEWEALCDGCGKCCLNKIEDADTGEIALTRVACRMLDDSTCRCSNYRDRRKYVPRLRRAHAGQHRAPSRMAAEDLRLPAGA